VKGLTPADVPHLKTRVYQMMEAGLKRYNASWIADVS
jgi:hypothetical protein